MTAALQTSTRWEVASSRGHYYAATHADAQAWARRAVKDGAVRLKLTEHTETVRNISLAGHKASAKAAPKPTKRTRRAAQ